LTATDNEDCELELANVVSQQLHPQLVTPQAIHHKVEAAANKTVKDEVCSEADRECQQLPDG
jgi:hypothetical protein